ncbi:hypothetical protein K7H99_21580 (plasmid) [Providencia rettgeri]|uniref:hypothetical protein n=1 Tax=Providencia rettgeri TaxID=587 RepID=UPI001CA63C6A|nr:hypothetical protein K7H99_21580 [Providencia rettgeri]
MYPKETINDVSVSHLGDFCNKPLIAHLDIQQWDPLFGQLSSYSSHNASGDLKDLID